MSMSTWSKTGSSEKAQQSQTIKIILKTLQYLAENAASNAESSATFVKVAAPVINKTFNVSARININEQVNSLLSNLGWKNSKITLKSGDNLEVILGSNRYLDQNSDNIPGLKLLVKAICIAAGNHILGRSTDALVNFDVINKSYSVQVHATEKLQLDGQSDIKTSMSSIDSTYTPNQPGTRQSTPTVTVDVAQGAFDTSQIILPVINNKLPLVKIQSLLKDVCEEFARSWYGQVPELTGSDDDTNLAILLNFLVSKASEQGNDLIDLGSQVGTYFADAISSTFTDEPLSQEIIEGSTVGSIIRDIKARSLCTLNLNQSCGTKIGGNNRRFCDISMGIWTGLMTKLTGKTYSFTGFYEAGKRDPYCLMEFSVN